MRKHLFLIPFFCLFINALCARAMYEQEETREPAALEEMREVAAQEETAEPAALEEMRELAAQEETKEPAAQEDTGEPAAQEDAREPAAQPDSERLIVQLDTAVKRLAGELNRRLVEERVEKIIIGQFSYQNSMPFLSQYWVNQLIDELTNIPDKVFLVISSGATGVDWSVSGELLEVADVIRVYTRLVRSSDRAVIAAFHTDIERNSQTVQLLSGGGGAGGGGSSFEFPMTYEIGANENVPVVNRRIQAGSEDYFLLVPSGNGRLVMETTGNTDTYMEFYDADSRELLEEDDDGGSGVNARIRYTVEAERRYILKVRGYSTNTAGNYGFRAYLQASISPDEYEPNNTSEQAKWIEIGTPQTHNFHNPDDVDWVRFRVAEPGLYVIRTRGTRSTRLDTYIELFNENLNPVATDDDGGDGLDSRLSIRLDAGVYYLKVECLNEPDQPYTISIERGE